MTIGFIAEEKRNTHDPLLLVVASITLNKYAPPSPYAYLTVLVLVLQYDESTKSD